MSNLAPAPDAAAVTGAAQAIGAAIWAAIAGAGVVGRRARPPAARPTGTSPLFRSSTDGYKGHIYKGHIAVDPDSEIVADTVVSAGNSATPRSPRASSTT